MAKYCCKGQYGFWDRRSDTWDLGRKEDSITQGPGRGERSQTIQVSSGSLWFSEGWAQSQPPSLVWREKMGKLNVTENRVVPTGPASHSVSGVERVGQASRLRVWT